MVAVIVRTGRKSESSVERHARRVAGHHHHGHRLADRAPHAQHHRGEDARTRRRHHHAPDRLPLGGAHGQAGVAVALGHRVQRILGHADDRGQRHVGQDQRAGEGGQPGGHAQRLRASSGATSGHAEEAQHHRGDARQHLDHRLEDLARPARAPPRARTPPSPRPAAGRSRWPSA